MPIYEYRCGVCAHRFEQFYSSMAVGAEHATLSCSECASGTATRVISSVAFIRPGTAGIGRSGYPTSWEQTNGGDSRTIRYWQRRVEREQAEEARHPELVGLREQAAAGRWQQEHPPTPRRETAQSPSSSSAAAPAPDWRHVPFIKPGAAPPGALHAHPHPHPNPHPRTDGGN